MSAPVRPTMIISEYVNDYLENVTDTIFFFYNGNKFDYIKRTHSKTTYEYSANEVILKNFRENDSIPWQYLKYLLDDKGRVKKVEFYLNVNSDYQGWNGPKIDSFELESYYYKYEYLADGTVKEKRCFSYSEENTADYDIYKYDSHGNIETISSYFYTMEQFEFGKIDSIEYDNKNHYMKNVDVLTMPSLESNINNITRIKTIHQGNIYNVTTNTYQYDNNGFPTRMQTEGDPDIKSMVFKY